MPTTKLTLSAVSKVEWDIKEDTGKCMKNALYIQMGKPFSEFYLISRLRSNFSVAISCINSSHNVLSSGNKKTAAIYSLDNFFLAFISTT